MPQCDTPTAPSPADDFAAVAVLAGLSGHNTRQIELLRIITNPAHNNGNIDGQTHAEIYEAYEDFSGYMDYGHNDEVQTVADFLYSHYASVEGAPQFSFGFDCNAEGEIGGYLVSADCGEYPNRITLATWGDIKNSTYDREATGLKAALAIAEALDDKYQTQVAKARQRGLIGTTPDLIERATAALAAFDAVSAEDDIDVDTLAEVRDALADMLGRVRQRPGLPCG